MVLVNSEIQLMSLQYKRNGYLCQPECGLQNNNFLLPTSDNFLNIYVLVNC